MPVPSAYNPKKTGGILSDQERDKLLAPPGNGPVIDQNPPRFARPGDYPRAGELTDRDLAAGNIRGFDPNAPTERTPAQTGIGNNRGRFYGQALGVPGLTPEQEIAGRHAISALGMLPADWSRSPELGTMPVGARVPVDGQPPAAGGRTGFGGMSLDNFSGVRNPMNFSGFNTERAFAGGDPNSVKDGFARVVAGLNLDLRGLDKPAVGEALRSQVIPALNAAGSQARMSPDSYDVIEVYSAERGWEPIDVVQNAGSADAAWAWQDLLADGGAQGGQGGGFSGAMNSLPGGSDLFNALFMDDGLNGSDVLRRIQAELEAMFAGRSPSTPDLPIPQQAR